ncbi:hypothetical protein TWF481_002617 [Arthrobotrys musiformis]|uniref:Uncharacterized protein n=1 Tax=Arthrobotrys musiformis TaxID=47236 RepID=A0AAV9VSW1_9PEZI
MSLYQVIRIVTTLIFTAAPTPEYEAFGNESLAFISHGLPAADIRQMLNIPEQEDVRKIMKNRDLDDPDEQIDIINAIGNLESLNRQTAEPRKFFEWFRYNYGRNTSKVKRRKRATGAETRDSPDQTEIDEYVDADGSKCERAGSKNATEKKEGGQPTPIIQDTNLKGWWNVVISYITATRY